jgi:ATP-binding cassette subfamily F protein uup
MALISLHNISVAFGGPNILEDITLQIEKNQRVCLLGRNGVGKSTLMRIIHGNIASDSGEVRKQQGVKVSCLEQQVPEIKGKDVFEVIAEEFGTVSKSLIEYRQLNTRLVDALSDIEIKRLHSVRHSLDTGDGWKVQQQVEKVISLLSLDADADFEQLSGGQKRRVLLAKAFANEPDLLLLDEPTNHLDIDSITWLEDLLIRLGVTLLFVTHDRMFLKKLATRIIELDRGRLVDWSCDYETFLIRKQAVLNAEDGEWTRFDRKLAQEEVWIRKGLKARRTRNEGRVRALEKMREERAKRRERVGTVSMTLQDADKSGRLVIKAKNISFAYTDLPIITNFTTTILRGDKVGIIGPNGSGKTTLINLLLGELTSSAGTLDLGANLEIIYFDQLRNLIDDQKTVQQNVLPNGEIVTINGNNKHIMGYLKDFLFTPEEAKTPVSDLSGGEKNRLALAKLFTKKSNLLVFDEPTNDLDTDTLELLEELLINYKGTVLLVSHDRAFLNNIVTSILVMEGNGVVKEYVGGYDDWIDQKKLNKSEKKVDSDNIKQKIIKKPLQKRKLSYNEKRELESLPKNIEQMEQELEQLHEQMADPEFYSVKGNIADAQKKAKTLEENLAEAYKRWEILDDLGL